MAAIDPPFCKICQAAHSTRDPHILPPDAPAEKRSVKRAIAAKVSAALFPPDSQSVFETKPSPVPPRLPRRDGDMNDTVKKINRREGRDVLKAQATSTERDHREAQPATATPGKKAGRQGTAAKPALGKRKTASKIIATYTPPKAKRKWVKKP